MHRTHSFVGAVGLAAALVLGSACASDVANKALKDAGVNATVGGSLPSGFPKDVPTPDLKLETGVGAAGTFTLRYTSKDPANEIAAYKKLLTDAGYTVAGETNNLGNAAAGGNVTLDATGPKWSVIVSAFDSSAPGGGNYMGVVVTPVG